MSEYVENMGRRVQLRQQRGRQAATCEALRDQLRRLLPDIEDVATLNGEGVLNAALGLQQSLESLAEVDRMLRVLDDKLGA